MSEKKGKGRQEEANSGPMKHGISGMMTNCCAGREGFPDCAAVRDGLIGQIRQHCRTDKGATKTARRRK